MYMYIYIYVPRIIQTWKLTHQNAKISARNHLGTQKPGRHKGKKSTVPMMFIDFWYTFLHCNYIIHPIFGVSIHQGTPESLVPSRPGHHSRSPWTTTRSSCRPLEIRWWRTSRRPETRSRAELSWWRVKTLKNMGRWENNGKIMGK